MDITTILIALIVIAVVLGIASYFLGPPNVPAPARGILWLVVAVVVILVILYALGAVHL